MGKQGPPHMQGQPPMQQGECRLTDVLDNDFGVTIIHLIPFSSGGPGSFT
jgi:hypothetical protein